MAAGSPALRSANDNRTAHGEDDAPVPDAFPLDEETGDRGPICADHLPVAWPEGWLDDSLMRWAVRLFSIWL